jgi:hypothetical protein
VTIKIFGNKTGGRGNVERSGLRWQEGVESDIREMLIKILRQKGINEMNGFPVVKEAKVLKRTL